MNNASVTNCATFDRPNVRSNRLISFRSNPPFEIEISSLPFVPDVDVSGDILVPVSFATFLNSDARYSTLVATVLSRVALLILPRIFLISPPVPRFRAKKAASKSSSIGKTLARSALTTTCQTSSSSFHFDALVCSCNCCQIALMSVQMADPVSIARYMPTSRP